MTQQPPGGGPPQPDSPTQPNYPTPPPPPGGYPPPPPPGGYPPPPPAGGYYAPPPPTGAGGVYMGPPPPNHTARNVVIGIIVVLLLLLILGAVYAATRPQSTLPPVTPSPIAASVEPAASKTPKPPKTEAPATEQLPTEQPATEEPATEPPATDEPATEEPATEEPATEPPATEVPASVVPPTGIAPSPGATIPGTEDQGIIFGEPVVIGEIIPEVVLLTQNVEDSVVTYSVKGTFKDGATITATATGIVDTHLQGTIRVVTLFIDGTPGASDTLTVGLDSVIDQQDSTPEGDVAKQITFGPPTISTGIVPSVDVEVTNGSDATADVTVVAGILRDGQLVGTATGFLQTLEGGQTKTANLIVSGEIAETDQLVLTVDGVTIQEE